MENEMIGTAVEISEKYPLKESDRYILCTDGVYEMLTGDALNRLVSEAGSAVSCADLLYRQAIAEGGRDNLTVIVCEVRRQLLTDFSQSVFP